MPNAKEKQMMRDAKLETILQKLELIINHLGLNDETETEEERDSGKDVSDSSGSE